MFTHNIGSKHAASSRLLSICILLLTTTGALSAQSDRDTTQEAVPLKETVVAASRTPESRTNIAQQVTVIPQHRIQFLNTANTADLMAQSGAAFVQKSQQGGGSPVLRGFEASRVLLMVDGVRMNNGIYRAGHLQNILTVDQGALDRVEVLYGPASTLYGTDALGGAICMYTLSPMLAGEGKKMAASGNVYARYATATQEKTTHVDLRLGGRKLASVTSFTYSDFGDVRMGEKAGSGGNFGLRPYYVERINGKDSLVANDDQYVQRNSGYTQYDVLQKIMFQPSPNQSHTLNIQYSTSTDIPRYDRLTDPGSQSGSLAFAEWYYGPQERLLAAYHFEQKHAGLFDRLETTLSYQDIQESRHSRRFNSSSLTRRYEDLQVFGLTAAGHKQWANQRLIIGLDGQYNNIVSTAYSRNVNDLTEKPASTRYPDGGSTVSMAAVFATHQWMPGNGKVVVSEGLRAGWNSLLSTFEDRSFYPFPYTEASQQHGNITGNLGLIWHAPAGWRTGVNLSSGFRAPNVDDLAKVFESAKGSVIVPNPDLKPEYTYNADLNITKEIADRFRWENVLWSTLFRNAIVTDVFQFNGQDSVEYDGVISQVLANQNKRKATLWGFSSILEADVTNTLAVYGSVSYTRGRIQEEEGSSPLDHIPPVFGRAGVRYHTEKLTLETFAVFNGKKSIDDYLLNGEDNEQYAPADGMPAWYTLNVHAGYRFARVFTLQAGVDNLLDAQYRTFASGINAPGRNVFVTLRLKF